MLQHRRCPTDWPLSRNGTSDISKNDALNPQKYEKSLNSQSIKPFTLAITLEN